MFLHKHWWSQYVTVHVFSILPSLCCPILEAACHFETCKSETCCVFVTRRLFATGGGKKMTFTSLINPEEGDRAGSMSVMFRRKRRRRRRKTEGKLESFPAFNNFSHGLIKYLSIYLKYVPPVMSKCFHICTCTVKFSLTSARGMIPCMSALLM